MSALHAKADDLNDWSYSRFLKPPNFDYEVPQIKEAADYMDAARISQHPFFGLASANSELLRVWAQQELITSSCFSQVITEWMATIDNCHIRSLVLPVFSGEHGDMCGAVACNSHPYLAEQLCLSLNCALDELHVIPATQEFIDRMEDSAASPIGGAGFLGIGNERMLLEEYGAVRVTFERTIPKAKFADFLDRNIEDDHVHHELIERAARALVSLGDTDSDRHDLANTFLSHAKSGVDARMEYYDRLVEYLT